MRTIYLSLMALLSFVLCLSMSAQTISTSGNIVGTPTVTQNVIDAGNCNDCNDITVEFVVNFSFDGGFDWIHGVSLDLNTAYHDISATGLPGGWISYAGCTGCATGCNGGGAGGNVFGEGFYYDGTGSGGCATNPGGGSGDGNPCNNWGQGSGVQNFSMTITTDICGCDAAGGLLPPLTINVSDDGASGGWSACGAGASLTINPATIPAAEVCCPDPAFTDPVEVFCNDAPVDLAPINTVFELFGTGWSGALGGCVSGSDACGVAETALFDPCGCNTCGTYDLTHTVGYDTDCNNTATVAAVNFVTPVLDVSAVATDYCPGEAPAVGDVVVNRCDGGAWNGPTATVTGFFGDAGCAAAFNTATPTGCTADVRPLYVKLETGCNTCDICELIGNVNFYPDAAAWAETNTAGSCGAGTVTVTAVNADVCFTQSTAACTDPGCGPPVPPDDTESDAYSFTPGFPTTCNPTFAGNVTCTCAPTGCCPAGATVAAAVDVCDGGAPGLVTAEADLLAGMSNAGLAGAFAWYTDAAGTMPYAGTSAHTAADKCNFEAITLYGGVVCTSNSSVIVIGNVGVNIYPDPADWTFTLTNNGACGPSLVSCPGFTITNTYDANGAAPDFSAEVSNGGFDFTITNPAAPAGCETRTDPATYDCRACPTSTQPTETDEICDGDVPTLPDAAIQAAVTDDSGTQFGGISWFEDAAFTTPYAGAAIAYPAAGDGCAAEIVTLYAAIECDPDQNGVADPPFIIAGQLDLTVYPDPADWTFTLTNDGACGPSLVSCPGFTITNSYDANGGTPDFLAEVSNGGFDFTITNPAAPAGCEIRTDPATFDCRQCPTSTEPTETTNICDGGVPVLPDAAIQAAVTDPSLTQINGVMWFEDLARSIPYAGAGIAYAGDACNAVVVTLYASIECDIDQNGAADSMVDAGQLDVTVYPSIDNTHITINNDAGCGPTVTNTCANFTVVNDFDANGDTPDYSNAFPAGSITFTVTNALADAALGSSASICETNSTFTATYGCCPNLDVFGAGGAVCTGDAFGFSASVVETNAVEGVDYTASWAGPSGSLTTANGAIPMTYLNLNGDGCTETQTYTLTMTCSYTGVDFAVEDIDVDVSPDVTATASYPAAPLECQVEITQDCPDFTATWEAVDASGNIYTGTGFFFDGDIQTPIATVGTVSFTVTNPLAPDVACETFEIPYEYKCCIADAGFLITSGICPEDDFVVDVRMHEGSDLYNTYLLVVDPATNAILDIVTVLMNGSGNAPGLITTTVTLPYTYWTGLGGTGVDYDLYSYNELDAKMPNPAPAVGGDVTLVGTGPNPGDDVCYDLSAKEEVFIPAPFDYLGLGPNVGEGVTGGLSPFYYNTHEVDIIGGTPPYNYEWDETGYVRHSVVGEGSVRIIYADDAIWTVTITDSQGCTDDELVFTNDLDGTLGENYIIDIESYTITGDNPFTTAPEGAITIDVIGGQTAPGSGVAYAGSYNVSWTGPGGYSMMGMTAPGAGMETFTITGLASGWYEVTVWIDLNGDGMFNDDGTEEATMGWYWVARAIPGGRSKMAVSTIGVAPNPFTDFTSINFATSETGEVELALYDLNGKKIAQLFNGELEAGTPQSLALAADELAAGVYLLSLTHANGEASYQKLVVTP